MATKSKLRAGRRWKLTAGGVESLSREYVVVLDGGVPLAADGELDHNALHVVGIPAIGSTHPAYAYLFVDGYDVEEGAQGDRNTLRVTVNYKADVLKSEGGSGEEGDEPWECAVEEWGWNDGTAQRELNAAVDGTPVLNSAQDPFDSVPQVDSPAPVFTKTFRSVDRVSGWNNYLCKVNKGVVSIGGISFPARTLLCTVAERRILDGSKWNYRYNVNIRYRSNKVKIEGGMNPVEIGWDVSVTDTGMREWDPAGGGKKVLIRVMDEETGKMSAISSPVLLDGSGRAQTPPSGTAAAKPYNFRYQAYEEVDFASWLYSEPPITTPQNGGS